MNNTQIKTTPSVNKHVVLNVPVPVAVIFKRDPAQNMVAILKDSLSFQNDPDGTVEIWFNGRGAETTTMPKSYYDKCDPLNEAETELMSDKFKAAFDLPYIEIKSRLGKNLHSIKARHTGQANEPVKSVNDTMRRATDKPTNTFDHAAYRAEMQAAIAEAMNSVDVKFGLK